MLDTVILSIPSNAVRNLDMRGRGVDPWDLQARTKTYEKFVRNPSDKDKASGLYYPRITGIRRAEGRQVWASTLKIEFSAPKLLYQNNLQELIDGDFERVVDALADRLLMMGVAISAKELASASVRAVHYSKNVPLTEGYTAQYAIRELSKTNAHKRFDLARFRFINDGESLQIYSTSNSFVIYDKVADLKKGPRRAIDKDQTTYQTNLFKSLDKQQDILRLEARLSQKRKLNALFKQLGFATDPTFRDAFSVAKSQKVLQHYWATFIAGYGLTLFAHGYGPKDLLAQVLLAEPEAKGKTAIYLTGLLLLARDENGLRELRAMLAKRIDDRSWHRMAADLRAMSTALARHRPREWYEQVAAALKTYQPYKVACK